MTPIESTRLKLAARVQYCPNWSNVLRRETSQRTNRSYRGGFTMTEVLVSAVLLMTIMSLVGTVCHRVNRIWFDVDHHRVAVSELSNHLEELTAMTLDQAAVAIKSMEPSESCCQALDSPQLTGEIFEDKLGTRVVLKINWTRPIAANPVEMSGWIIPAQQEASPDDLSNSQGQP